MPETPCVVTKVKCCLAKLHQDDLFDLQATHTINDFFSPLPPSALILLPCQSSHFPFFPLITHLFLGAVSCFIIPLIPVSLCVFPQSSSLTLLHVISFISFVFHPPDLPLHIFPLPLPPLLWQAAHCSESVSWRQAAGLPQWWGVQH